MDISVLAAVGSFAVSERILKPKATVLVILGCILAYDLTTKTHDVSSLRVYRGPALLAFTLMCFAYSLRTWRRNGVACDELLFLPGTPHGVQQGIESPLVVHMPRQNQQEQQNMTTESSLSLIVADEGVPSLGGNDNNDNSTPLCPHDEGDAAAGLGSLAGGNNITTNDHPSRNNELVPILNDDDGQQQQQGLLSSSLLRAAASSRRILNLNHSISEPIPMRSFDDDDAVMEGSTREQHPVVVADANGATAVDDDDDFDSWDGDESSDEELQDTPPRTPPRSNLMIGGGGGTNQQQPRNLSAVSMDYSEDEDEVGGGEQDDDEQQEGEGENELERFQHNHPRITRIGTFFFFRSPASSSTTENAAYAPSGPSVFGAALDLSMPILFNFHLFIEAYNHMGTTADSGGGGGGESTAKILPLIFLSVLIVRSFFPPSRRRRFWATLKFTAMAPFHKLRFRDAFLGDVLTSLVRPIQDILFALSYYATVIYGTILGSYGLTEAGLILEKSWFLHNVILPSCALLPLWWKFLQTLRQSYDADKRWPYLGDAFKYMSAAMVIIYGMTHPEDRRSSWWLICFVLAVLYQIVWDTMVDWELFVIVPRGEAQPAECQSPLCSSISSLRPSSRVLLAMQMYLFQPISDGYRLVSAKIPSWDQIQLRPKRLYKKDHFYWRIFIVNVMLRFTWMLCFIPAYRLSSSSEKEATFSSDVNSYIGVLLPVAEIVRRCYWGFLKVEMETIKMMDADVLYSRVDNGGLELPEVEETPDKDRSAFRQLLPTWLDTQQKQQHHAATSSSRSKFARLFKFSDGFLELLFHLELALWACAFVGFGYWAACL